MACPACGSQFDVRFPAISRLDNKTAICPKCGDLEEKFLRRAVYKKRELISIIWQLMQMVPPEKSPSKYRSIDDE